MILVSMYQVPRMPHTSCLFQYTCLQGVERDSFENYADKIRLETKSTRKMEGEEGKGRDETGRLHLFSF